MMRIAKNTSVANELADLILSSSFKSDKLVF
jgi:hypothetical protein